MNQTIRGLSAALAVALTVSVFSGCAFLRPPERFSDEATLREQVDAIELDDPEGGVTIHGVDDAIAIEVSRTVSYRGTRTVGTTYEISDGVLVLSGCGRNCRVSYTIELPTGADVTGSTSNGGIELRGVDEVDVETSNGRVELSEVTGRIDVETSNGRIDGVGLNGDGVRASSSNGAIELALGASQDVEARTSNGAITLTVPTDPGGYQVSANTSNGSTDIEIDHDPGGRFLLDLNTSNGSITVKAD